MDCHHFDAGECRSCSWLRRPYADQLAAKQSKVAGLLAAYPGLVWLPPVSSEQSGFRNKAKMVVTGTIDAPVLGILTGDHRDPTGVDLADCPLHVPAIQEALGVISAFITRAGLEPYDIAARRGELKLVLVTASPDEELMIRFVARSQEPVARLRKHLGWLREQLPGLRVATLNVQPEHKAVLEGDVEIVLTDESVLPMRLGGVELLLRPQSFFQTSTATATALYAEARAWTDLLDPREIWDLYCGVGGFALHLAAPGRRVLGVETSHEAVRSAQEAAQEVAQEAVQRGGVRDVEFLVGDATTALVDRPAPDLVVLNPPRRGIGPELARWLERSGVRRVLYSSCNPATLAADMMAMPSLAPVRGRVFDMFPNTAHAEVLVLAERSRS
ncbi:MAG TPA: 23S rRNA (uracil(747)-C(5))-methyltransferase RlmC [Marmoricola sp.]|jgi:23S rRNA (uracil747-C5)-methyltransferase|nr:23S rRNA (uracil(747)-C(5))-methyltransferase RlmC [Marmoricola sp.]